MGLVLLCQLPLSDKVLSDKVLIDTAIQFSPVEKLINCTG